jgi:hypothetical protein
MVNQFSYFKNLSQHPLDIQIGKLVSTLTFLFFCHAGLPGHAHGLREGRRLPRDGLLQTERVKDGL